METHSGQGGRRYQRARIPSKLEPLLKKHLHYFRVEVKRIGSELNAIGDIHQLELIAVRLGGYVCG